MSDSSDINVDIDDVPNADADTDVDVDEPDESGEGDRLPWDKALGLGAAGILVFAVINVLWAFDVIGPSLVSIGHLVGTGVAIAGLYFLVVSLRKGFDTLVGSLDSIMDAYDGLAEAIDDDPLAARQELLRQIRRQQRLTEHLLDDLPEQQQSMEELASELSQRNKIVRAVLDDDIDDIGTVTGPGTGPTTNSDASGEQESDTNGVPNPDADTQ